eukprot:6203112-Pleurochrysis_carterae.AAC.2
MDCLGGPGRMCLNETCDATRPRQHMIIDAIVCALLQKCATGTYSEYLTTQAFIADVSKRFDETEELVRRAAVVALPR